MKKAKLINKSNKSNDTKKDNTEYSVKELIKIILIVVIVFAVFYVITTLVVKPANKVANNSNSQEQVKADDSTILLNHLFDMSDHEYYVLATKENSNNGIQKNTSYLEIYSKYIDDYKNDENSLNFYFVDLDETLNKAYISDKSNITDNLNDLKLSDDTLFKIKDGKIENYYEGKDLIIQTLSSLK